MYYRCFSKVVLSAFFFVMKRDATKEVMNSNYQTRPFHMRVSEDVKIRDGTIIIVCQYKSRGEHPK